MSDSKKSPISVTGTADDNVTQEFGVTVKETFLKGKLIQALETLEASRVRPLGGRRSRQKRESISNKFVGWRRR